MYYQKGKRGLYSFLYYDTTLKKNMRLTRSEIPVMSSDEEADAFCQKWEAKNDASKHRTRLRLQWIQKYHNFEELKDQFREDQKTKAPNTYEMDAHYLKLYVFPYFLTEKNENNLNLWPHHFQAFKAHLNQLSPLKKGTGKKLLADSTKNNAIKALNAFLRFVQKELRKIDLYEPCPLFPSSESSMRDVESLLSSEEQDRVVQSLLDLDPRMAKFFYISLHTGLRLNEILGLSLPDFVLRSKTEQARYIEKCLKPFGLKAHGYLIIESQPARGSYLRDEKGEVLRKPLKGKKAMKSRNSRVIPICDKRAFNYLVELWNQQRLLFSRKVFGLKAKNYLLFDGVTRSSFSRRLTRAQEKLNLRRIFTCHDARHTYATWLVEFTRGDYNLARIILGHSKEDMTKRYVHIHERVTLELQSQAQLLKPMEMIA